MRRVRSSRESGGGEQPANGEQERDGQDTIVVPYPAGLGLEVRVEPQDKTVWLVCVPGRH